MDYLKLKQNYPAIKDLRARAKKRIPHVAWEYLETGTGRENLLKKNMQAFNEIALTPKFCKGIRKYNVVRTLFDTEYDAPFGIAPMGLMGLMWPKTEVFLAKTAKKYNIPFSLSTVATETPEKVGKHVGNSGWFQLYPPRDITIRKDILRRAWESGFHTLLITADVPMPSFRERTIRAGLKTPVKISPTFIWQGIMHPKWSVNTLKSGLPRLKTIENYTANGTEKEVMYFMKNHFGGSLSWEYCKAIRDEWKGPIVIKGLLHPEDALIAVEIGMDGVLVSNHGGRQFDGAPTSISALKKIVEAVKGKTAILYDSGVRSGLDILRAIHLGADFVLLGRAFVYGVAALGSRGGDYVVELLREDLINNMAQLGISSIADLHEP